MEPSTNFGSGSQSVQAQSFQSSNNWVVRRIPATPVCSARRHGAMQVAPAESRTEEC
jgi:hypothetical protein